MDNILPWSIDTAAARLKTLETRLDQNSPELQNVFTQTFFSTADTQITAAKLSLESPLRGALVSVKDLFDVAGFVTKAGTRVMAQDDAALKDAGAIENLREAGAIFVGHTNMTELAYSGLGLNPHYGTPDNARVKGCIPGGSSAGGAISVACDAVDIAIGTDTGGSLRIPAAFNGIVGFKPSQSVVSRKGCKPLSTSLDSVGPMAKNVATCHLAYRALAMGHDTEHRVVEPTFIIPNNYGMSDLEPAVQQAFESAVGQLSAAGYRVQVMAVDALEGLKSLAVWQFSAVESRAEYEDLYQSQRGQFDARVSSRMARADEVSAIAYCRTLRLREQLITQYKAEMGDKILLMPTVPMLPPKLSVFNDDEVYTRINLQVLRNPSIANVMDGCSISLPFSHGTDTIGVMLTATAYHDESLLELAQECERLFE